MLRGFESHALRSPRATQDKKLRKHTPPGLATSTSRRHSSAGRAGLLARRAPSSLRAEARDLAPRSGDELVVRVGVTEEAPAAGDRLGQQHPGLLRKVVVAGGVDDESHELLD